ncbi:uncharacterized protein conserved in archaea [Cenarchaeum symbiosum A]|uniref:Uncharacterized protein conserved in archaea n=1 Tax=Cenarchaeum symbiosum (strain A) TaxID=414004 RepID=A0RYI1_CENSY|nr:uncharacterized protein conserved in archaea [Cenarchaeum symbiosum A]
MQIMEVITKNPGIKFREIMRATGLKNGVLSHHLGKMERSGTVQAVREPRQTRFYPLEISESESKIIKSLRRGTPRKILRSLMLNKEGLEFGEIVNESSKSPSTVSLYLSRMVDDGVVQVALENRKKRYFISERASVDRLIEDYHPGMLDAPAGGIEDIINVL